MNDAFFIASIIFMYISYGCAWKYTHRKRVWVNDDGTTHQLSNRGDISAIGKLLNNLICLLAYVLPVISYCKIFNFGWYWLILINFGAVNAFSHLFASIYSCIFGYRTGLECDMSTFATGRAHRHDVDMLITMSVGLILFILVFVI